MWQAVGPGCELGSSRVIGSSQLPSQACANISRCLHSIATCQHGDPHLLGAAAAAASTGTPPRLLEWSFQSRPRHPFDRRAVESQGVQLRRRHLRWPQSACPCCTPLASSKPRHSGWVAEANRRGELKEAACSLGGRVRRFWSSKKAVEPATGEEAKWRAWVDATFVKLVTANIYSSWGQSFQTMKYITESGSWGSIERALAYNGGAVLMYAIGSRMPKKYGFEGDLRVLLYKELDTFIDSSAHPLSLPVLAPAVCGPFRPPSMQALVGAVRTLQSCDQLRTAGVWVILAKTQRSLDG